MINRRQFLRNTAIAGAALGSAELLAKPAAAENSLPPPIAALKSMKDQARPISKDERRQRIERARQLMAENKLDAILMCGGTSLVYFINSNSIAQLAPTLELVSAIPVTAACRRIKSDAELALMQLANTVTLKAYEAAYRSLKEGLTQEDFAHFVSAAHEQLALKGGA